MRKLVGLMDCRLYILMAEVKNKFSQDERLHFRTKRKI